MSIPINRYLLAVRPAIILSPVISHIIDINPRYTSDCIGNILKMLLFYLFPCNNLHISARPCVGLLCNNISKCIPHLVHVCLNNHFIQVVYSLRMDSAHRKCQYRRCSTNSFVHSDRLLFNHHSIYYNKNIIKFKFYINITYSFTNVFSFTRNFQKVKRYPSPVINIDPPYIK